MLDAQELTFGIVATSLSLRGDRPINDADDTADRTWRVLPPFCPTSVGIRLLKLLRLYLVYKI